MGTISSGVGLISGINSKDIIDQLISIETQPKTLLQGRQAKVNAQKDAYSGIIDQLNSIQGVGRALERPTTFTATATTSSDENVLTATTSASAAVGSYQFQVARLVTSQQAITAGYADTNATVGAGTISIELGGGNLNTQTDLSQLNGGAGVRRGLFRITDRSGKASVIDISTAVNTDDVLRKINTALDIGIKASTQGDKIVLTDTTGASVNDIKVEDLADGHSAADLGIAGTAVAGETSLTGTDVVYLGQSLSLASLNDGRGIRHNATGPDFTVTAGGTTTSVTLGANVKTLGDVIKAINAAGGSNFKAQVSGTGNGLQIVDTSGGGSVSVAAADPTSFAAADLGIAGKTSTGGTLTGDDLLAGLNTVLLGSLNGGAGLPTGTITISNRAGVDKTVDLSAAKSVQDILDAINKTAGLSVEASLKSSGNGIQLIDKSGGTGNLVVDDVSSTTAAALGIKGTFDDTTTAVQGANLQLKWVNENSLLSTYNGGKAVSPGIFTITNSTGARTDINLTQGTFTTLGDVITEINSHATGVTASVNAHGDGLLLTDTAGGGSKLKVENKSGTTATDLNIVGTATGTTIDGSFEKTIDVTSADTLSTVQGKIRDLGFGVSAAVVNDGSGQTPFRLSLTSLNSGKEGRVSFDAGATSLQTRNLVEAQDAAVFVGGTDAADPLLVTSSQNQLANVIPGVTIDLHGVSKDPVTLNVSRNADDLVKQIQTFTDTFNAVVDKVADLTKFDPDTQQAGLLLGEGTIQEVQSQIYTSLTAVVQGAGRYTTLADLGLTLTDDAKITFDEDKFRTAYATDPDAIKNLFTQTGGTKLDSSTTLSQLNNGRGVSVSGSPDFKITTKDGSSFDVSVPPAGALGDVIDAISKASGGKVTAAVSTNGLGLQLTDNSTTGSSVFTVASLNASKAADDLGISGPAAGSVLLGRQIFTPNPANGGGIGFQLDKSMAKLIDPVDGVIVRQNQTLDDRSKQFQDRMDALDKLIADKRARLERQFANMETVLAKLQSQQSALGSLSGATSSSAKAATTPG